jgi:hypothetical protein
MHWFIVIPYYFLGAIFLAALLAVASRLLRAQAALDDLAPVASLGSIGALAILLGAGVIAIDDLTIPPLLILGVGSFILAGIDQLLTSHRPLASEEQSQGRGSIAPHTH